MFPGGHIPYNGRLFLFKNRNLEESRTTLIPVGDIVEPHPYLRLPESRPRNSDVTCRPPPVRSRPYRHVSHRRDFSLAGRDNRSSLRRNDRESQHRLQESTKFRRKGSTDGKGSHPR